MSQSPPMVTGSPPRSRRCDAGAGAPPPSGNSWKMKEGCCSRLMAQNVGSKFNRDEGPFCTEACIYLYTFSRRIRAIHPESNGPASIFLFLYRRAIFYTSRSLLIPHTTPHRSHEQFIRRMCNVSKVSTHIRTGTSCVRVLAPKARYKLELLS